MVGIGIVIIYSEKNLNANYFAFKAFWRFIRVSELTKLNILHKYASGHNQHSSNLFCNVWIVKWFSYFIGLWNVICLECQLCMVVNLFHSGIYIIKCFLNAFLNLNLKYLKGKDHVLKEIKKYFIEGEQNWIFSGHWEKNIYTKDFFWNSTYAVKFNNIFHLFFF